MPARIWSDIQAAWKRRGYLHEDPETSAYRLFHGHAEGRSGLDIERFGEAAVVRCRGQLEIDTGAVLDALESCHSFLWIGLKRQSKHTTHRESLEVTSLRGTFPEGAIEVRDNGLRFLVEPFDRRSSGLFLDARSARAWLLDHSDGRRVLNLFAFTGSLGVAAAVGGAREVIHVDLLSSALERAKVHHEINQVPADARSFVKGNVYAHLPRAARARQRFDGIVLDPPPELPRGRHKRRLLDQGYPELACLCAPLLEKNGWLLCFFHRYERTRAEYEEQIQAHAGVPLEVIHRGQSGVDFPEEDPEHKMRYSVFARS